MATQKQMATTLKRSIKKFTVKAITKGKENIKTGRAESFCFTRKVLRIIKIKQ